MTLKGATVIPTYTSWWYVCSVSITCTHDQVWDHMKMCDSVQFFKSYVLRPVSDTGFGIFVAWWWGQVRVHSQTNEREGEVFLTGTREHICHWKRKPNEFSSAALCYTQNIFKTRFHPLFWNYWNKCYINIILIRLESQNMHKDEKGILLYIIKLMYAPGL